MEGKKQIEVVFFSSTKKRSFVLSRRATFPVVGFPSLWERKKEVKSQHPRSRSWSSFHPGLSVCSTWFLQFTPHLQDVVNWTPSTGYLARLPTKHTFLHLTFQFVSQRNVQELPIHNQDSLYFILVVSGSDLIVKVWFVCIVLALAFLGFSWRCSWSFFVVPPYLSLCILSFA